MDFSISEDTQRMVQVIRDFMQAEVYPLEQEFLNSNFRQMLPVLREKRQRVKSARAVAAAAPGGIRRAGAVPARVRQRERGAGRSPLGHYLFNCQAPDAGNMEILIQYGTPEQKERLPEAARRRARFGAASP